MKTSERGSNFFSLSDNNGLIPSNKPKSESPTYFVVRALSIVPRDTINRPTVIHFYLYSNKMIDGPFTRIGRERNRKGLGNC